MLATAVQVNMDEIGNRILSVFSVSANYGAVKIAHFNFCVVLQTTEHTMIYHGSYPSFKVIVIHSVI
jgi:hypothetical protein